MDLRQYVAEQYKMNVAEFARKEGYDYKSALRYVENGAKWIDGEVYIKTAANRDKSCN